VVLLYSGEGWTGSHVAAPSALIEVAGDVEDGDWPKWESGLLIKLQRKGYE